MWTLCYTVNSCAAHQVISWQSIQFSSKAYSAICTYNSNSSSNFSNTFFVCLFLVESFGAISSHDCILWCTWQIKNDFLVNVFHQFLAKITYGYIYKKFKLLYIHTHTHICISICVQVYTLAHTYTGIHLSVQTHTSPTHIHILIQ